MSEREMQDREAGRIWMRPRWRALLATAQAHGDLTPFLDKIKP
jgi:hypothetical protein